MTTETTKREREEAIFMAGWRMAVQAVTQALINDGQRVFAERLREQFSAPPAPFRPVADLMRAIQPRGE